MGWVSPPALLMTAGPGSAFTNFKGPVSYAPRNYSYQTASDRGNNHFAIAIFGIQNLQMTE
jgi:hypothetical protein